MKRVGKVGLLIAIFVCLALNSTGCLFAGGESSDLNGELLIVWGSTLNGQGCILQIVNPNQRATSSYNRSTCNFSVSQIEDIPTLIQVDEAAGLIEYFAISSDGTLTKQNEIQLDGVRITSRVFLDANGTLYVNGIVDEKEVLLTIQADLSDYDLIATPDGGTVVLSSSNIQGLQKLIVYQLRGMKTQFECQLNCYPRFMLFDPSTQSFSDVLSLLPSDIPRNYTHCSPSWSPDLTYVAFIVGCGPERPNWIVIIDSEKFTLEQTIVSTGPRESLDLLGWLSSDEIALLHSSQNVPEASSVTTGATRVLSGISMQGNRIFFIDIAAASGTFVGLFDNPESGFNALVIGDIDAQLPQDSYVLDGGYNTMPTISQSGDWIAVLRNNAQTIEALGPEVYLTVIDSSGDVIWEDLNIQFSQFGAGVNIRWLRFLDG
ncbi:MAG: hypothetical protein KDE59_31055 [Anaerolineales bacterium]|nr:hypothetical protein [Anaerolineales bacterium]